MPRRGLGGHRAIPVGHLQMVETINDAVRDQKLADFVTRSQPIAMMSTIAAANVQ